MQAGPTKRTLACDTENVTRYTLARLALSQLSLRRAQCVHALGGRRRPPDEAPEDERCMSNELGTRPNGRHTLSAELWLGEEDDTPFWSCDLGWMW